MDTQGTRVVADTALIGIYFHHGKDVPAIALMHLAKPGIRSSSPAAVAGGGIVAAASVCALQPAGHEKEGQEEQQQQQQQQQQQSAASSGRRLQQRDQQQQAVVRGLTASTSQKGQSAAGCPLHKLFCRWCW